MRRGTLIIFVKEPRVGRVKTRLGREIGMVRAALWYRRQTTRLIRRLAHFRRWRMVLAVTPDRAVRTSRAWPAHVARLPQGPGDLGERMSQAMAAMGPGPVLLIGSDIPGITAADIAAGFALLGQNDVVLGPAKDGGYWLIGLANPHRQPGGLFHGVRWSTAHAMADTITSLDGLPVGFCRTLADVDRAADLMRVVGVEPNTQNVEQ